MHASIAIFQKSTEPETESRPLVPQEVWEAIQRVLKNKSCELVKTNQGMYIVNYSESGPFNQNREEWIPVYVARMIQWSSGGITQEEWKEFQILSTSKTSSSSINA